MPTNEQLDRIDKAKMNVILGGQDVGWLEEDTLAVNVRGEVQELRVDQLAGVAKEWEEGFDISVTLGIYSTDPNFLNSVLMAGRLGARYSSAGKLGIGFGNLKVDLRQLAQTLRLHQYGIDDTVRDNDWYFWLASAVIDTAFEFGKGRVKKLNVTFKIYPDTTKETRFQFGMNGDWAAYAEDVAPDGVAIYARSLYSPNRSLSAGTLADGAVQGFGAVAFYSTAGDVTAAIDDGDDISATDTTIVYDTLAGGAFVAGDIIGIDDELMLVLTNTGGDTLTVERGANGTVAAIHLDDAVITKRANVNSMEVTDIATWASSDPTKATVGNTFQSGTIADRKGVVSHVAAGATNVTATVRSVSSPNLAITAS